MQDLLDPANHALLDELGTKRSLLAFDFDGTLAPLTSQREAAVMRPQTRELLARVCERFPCAVISGRSRADTEARVVGVPVRYVIGNHGLEPGGDLLAAEQVAAEAIKLVQPLLSRWPGVELEDKRYSFSLHYRMAERRSEVAPELTAMLLALPIPLRVIAGKMVLNAVKVGAPDKGDALLTIVEQEGAELALFIGDDVTDEDVFELHRRRHLRQPWKASAGRVMTVRVGQSDVSAAKYYVRGQQQVDDLLARLAELRQERAAP
jgi:trehalose 6-phosphate phosphatase